MSVAGLNYQFCAQLINFRMAKTVKVKVVRSRNTSQDELFRTTTLKGVKSPHSSHASQVVHHQYRDQALLEVRMEGRDTVVFAPKTIKLVLWDYNQIKTVGSHKVNILDPTYRCETWSKSSGHLIQPHQRLQNEPNQGDSGFETDLQNQESQTRTM